MSGRAPPIRYFVRGVPPQWMRPMTPRRIMKIDPQTWPALSQLLDDWLDLPPEARSSWLENLGPEYADVLPTLRGLLATQAMGGTDTFLNALPALRDAGECEIVALAAGAKLGPYEILAPIGAGGMGEVYRIAPG